MCLCACVQERDLTRIELLWSSDVKKGKIKSRICALKAHLTDIQRQKQTVNEYLFSNNETVGRVLKEVNTICKDHPGGVCVCVRVHVCNSFKVHGYTRVNMYYCLFVLFR